MVPYTIQCATCHRALTVRSAAAIGKILACPKCGSMVLVPPPPGSAAGESVPSPASAPPDSRKPRPADTFETDDARQMLAASDPQQADTVPDPLAQQIPPMSRREPQTPDRGTPAPSDTEGPLLPGTDWVSQEARQMRRWLMVGAVSLAGVLLIIIGAGFWISRGGRDAAQVSSADDGAPASRDPKSSSPSPDEARKDPETMPPPAERASAAVKEPSTPDPAPTPENSEPTSPKIEESRAGDPQPVVEAPPRPASDPAPAPSPDEPRGNPNGNVAGAVRPKLTVEESLRAFEGLMADAPFERVVAVGESRYDLIPSPLRQFDLSKAMPKPPSAKSVNIDGQLAIRIPELDFRDMPLIDFIGFVTDFTGIPITLDADGLYRMGLAADHPITVTLKDEDLRTALDRALTPLKLELLFDTRQLAVVPQGISQTETKMYDVFDLVGDRAEDNQWLRDTLTGMLAPNSWQAHGGSASLTVENGRMSVTASPILQHEVLMFCERLRIFRGGRPQGSVPDSFLLRRPRIETALAALGQPITISMPVATRWTDILREIAAASGQLLIVDWRALSEIGWNTDSLARLEVNDQPLSEALQELLGPMELSFRVIDARTLQITSAKAAFQTLEVEFFDVEPFFRQDEGRQLLLGLRAIFGDIALGRDQTGAARFDTQSRTLMVVAPQHQVAAVAGLLERLAETAEPEAADLLPVIE